MKFKQWLIIISFLDTKEAEYAPANLIVLRPKVLDINADCPWPLKDCCHVGLGDPLLNDPSI